MKNRIVATVIAIVLILICFVPVLLHFTREKGTDYEIVCFGDSVVAGYYGWETIPSYIEQYTGRRTLNAAFGGLSASIPYEDSKAGETTFLFSMVKLSEALLNRDFTLQIMGNKRNITEFPEEWYDIAKELDSLNYDSVKYVIIEHGVNDYLLGKQIEDPADPYNVYTFAGGLRTSIENVRKALPNATIVLATPIYTRTDYEDKDCYTADFGGGTLPEYVAKEKEIASEYGLILVDNFTDSGITAENYRDYLYDGLHTLLEGNILIVENIIRNVEGICIDENTP